MPSWRFEKRMVGSRIIALVVLVVLVVVSAATDDLLTSNQDASRAEATDDDHITAGDVFVEILRYALIVVLVSLSAIFSGLTLGLMSLDRLGLEVVIGAGERDEASDEERVKAEAAKRILPVRESGNTLLSTLVLGNVSVNCLLSILMADLTSRLVGFLISTIIIVIFGEIIPQALCSRHALVIGSRLVPLVKVLLFLFYPAAKPVGMALDYALGADLGTVFSKRELQKLLEIHVKQQTLHPAEGHIVRGAMDYKQKLVSQIMVPATKIYSLPISFSSLTELSMDAIKQIYSSGFSRIPVVGKNANDVLGIVFVKDLVYIDPKESVPLHEFVHVFARAAHRVWADSTLGEILSVFKKGGIHMALVYDVNNSGPGDPFYELKGMVALEDVVEEILQAKIADGTDSAEARRERKSCADRITLDYGAFRTPELDGQI